MYKLILVDDEEEVRKGILEDISWEKYGFTVVGEAENGRDAFEIAEGTSPDMVITDIKMPYMDGLKLSAQLKEKFPNIKVIILTGFDEFEFAQKAIKLQIDEYVLKPVLAEELISVLLKVKTRLDEEISFRDDIHTLRENYKKSLPILREKFLSSLMSRKLSALEIKEKSHNYSLDLEGHGFVVSITNLDFNNSVLDKVQNSDLTNLDNSLKFSDEIELKLLAAYNITEEIVSKNGFGIVFIHNDNIIILSICYEALRYDIMKKILPIHEEIRLSIEKYLKFTVTIAIGTTCNDISNISYSYKDTILALDYKLILGNDRIICIDDVESRKTEKVDFDELEEQALIRCIKVGTVSEINEMLEKLFSGFEDTKVHYKDYQIYILELLTTVLKATKGAEVDFDSVFGTNYNLLNIIYRFNSIREAKEWLGKICIKIMHFFSKERQDSFKNLIKAARDFIANNYDNSDLNLNEVADYLHISGGYV